MIVRLKFLLELREKHWERVGGCDWEKVLGKEPTKRKIKMY